jgi:hypothetical protein
MPERRPGQPETGLRPTKAGRFRRWTTPQAYPTAFLLLLFGLVAVFLAWLSLGLLDVAMSNLGFLRRHGIAAVAAGGLVQTAEIVARSAAVLLLYLAFRGIEVELVARWVGRRDD